MKKKREESSLGHLRIQMGHFRFFIAQTSSYGSNSGLYTSYMHQLEPT
jgi:hypothetical protein